MNRPQVRAVRGAVYVVLPLIFASSAAVRGFQFKALAWGMNDRYQA